MDYVNDFYWIHTVITTYGKRKTVFITYICYVSNECCFFKNNLAFSLNKGLSIACPYFPHFLIFSYSINKLLNKSVKIYGSVDFKSCVCFFSFLFLFFFFHQIVVLIESWKMLISFKKLISFSKYPRFCISLFPSSFPCQLLLEMMIKLNFKVYDVINWLNKILGTLFVWYLGKESRSNIETWSIDWVLNKVHFYEKVCRKFAPKTSPIFIFNFGK